MEKHPDRFKPIPVRPLGSRGGNQVWLEPEDEPEFSPSGLLHLPPHGESYGDDGKRPPIVAVVVAVGPGRILRHVPMGDLDKPRARLDGDVWREVPPVKLGDRVLVGAYEGHKVELGGRRFLVVYDVAPHAVVED